MVFSLLKDAVEFIDDHRHIKGGKPRNGRGFRQELHVVTCRAKLATDGWLVGWLVGLDWIGLDCFFGLQKYYKGTWGDVCLFFSKKQLR